jgi:predicted DNA-binding transcriptional regulator YafY
MQAFLYPFSGSFTLSQKESVMNETEKINIFISDRLINTLDSDARAFELFKKDGETINRNHFLNLLIDGYASQYDSEYNHAYEMINKKLTDSGNPPDQSGELADSILKEIIFPEIPGRKGKQTRKISLKPTALTCTAVSGIMRELHGDAVSQYFRRMFTSYAEKPFSERERIIFHKTVSQLNLACEKSRPVSFSTLRAREVIHDVIPYAICTGKEEMYNYLLCQEYSDSLKCCQAAVFRLNRITGLRSSSKNVLIDKDVKRHLDLMKRYGPQYVINDDEETCVRLSEHGEFLYHHSIYYGRPEYDRNEKKPDGTYYYFKGSKDQIFLYFRRFEKDDAIILSPASLRQRMIEFHQSALESYQKSNP